MNFLDGYGCCSVCQYIQLRFDEHHLFLVFELADKAVHSSCKQPEYGYRERYPDDEEKSDEKNEILFRGDLAGGQKSKTQKKKEQEHKT